mmetsp:Transcript_7238/g.27098  ORF Transcript_7238/g.27098 Transcript_7238/m.27098 type:complete len:86 (+) Transcript_7238:2198-2455(+)
MERSRFREQPNDCTETMVDILSNVVDEAEVEEDVSVVNVVVLVIEDEAEEGMVLDTEEEVMEIEGTDKLQMNQRAGISCVTIRVR